MTEKTLYRITTFFKRRSDLTEQQCYDHWGNVHAPLVVPWALKHGIKEYTQFMTPETLRKAFFSEMDEDFAATLEFDAAVDWYVESVEGYLAAYADPYYMNVIEPDEHNFIDKGGASGSSAGKKTFVRAISSCGFCRSMIKDGKAAILIGDDIWQKSNEYQK